jgi:hypothetical protein
VCTASDACHVAGTCDPNSGACSNPSAPDGTACTGSNKCLQAYACAGGTCTGSNPVTCTASDQCHSAGACDPASGICNNPSAQDGTPCTGGNKCLQAYACLSGACVGSNPVACTASDPCHVTGTCDSTTGVCSNPLAPDGTSCNDGNACTTSDVCTAGQCTGTPGGCSSDGGVADATVASDASSDAGSLPLTRIQAARSAYLAGATAIDLSGDGQPDWFLTGAQDGGPPTKQWIDLDHNGIAEWTRTTTAQGWTTTDDHDQDGQPDFVQVVTLSSNGGFSIVTTTYKGALPATRATITNASAGASLAFETIETYDPTSSSFTVVVAHFVPSAYQQSASGGANLTVDPSCAEYAAGFIDQALGAAAADGINCLDTANPLLSMELVQLLATQQITVQCNDATDGRACGQAAVNAPGPAGGQAPDITLYPHNCTINTVATLAPVLFHELLHSLIPVTVSNHNAAYGGNDPVYGCQLWCFGDPSTSTPAFTDFCRAKQCNDNQCGDGLCTSRCDPATGACTDNDTPVHDGQRCQLDDGCGPFFCNNGACDQTDPQNPGAFCELVCQCTSRGTLSSCECGPGTTCLNADHTDTICCAEGQVCSAGQCCPINTPDNCSGSCVNTQTDPNNCGGCGIPCAESGGTAGCINGQCCANPCEPLASDLQAVCCPDGYECTNGSCCPAGQAFCGGTCTDTSSDPNNCGSCGNRCPAGLSSCSGSQCICNPCSHAGETQDPTTCLCACPAGTTLCSPPNSSGGACVNTQSDANNCGVCGNACPAGEACVSGQCNNCASSCGTTCCAAGQSCCGTNCVDLSSDSNNCGTCGHQCPSPLGCFGSACRCPGQGTFVCESRSNQNGQFTHACCDSDPAFLYANCNSFGFVPASCCPAGSMACPPSYCCDAATEACSSANGGSCVKIR